MSLMPNLIMNLIGAIFNKNKTLDLKLATDKISRFFQNLEPHSSIQIDAELMSFSPRFPPQYLDGRSSNEGTGWIQQISSCPFVAYTVSNSSIFQHNRRNAWVDIFFNWAGGLMKFKLSIIKCQHGCIVCIQNYPQNCLQWKLHLYSINQKIITNSDGWATELRIYEYIFCGNCQFLRFFSVSYSTTLPPHQDVLIRFFLYCCYPLQINLRYGEIVIDDMYLIEILIKNYPDSILNLDISAEPSSEEIFIRDFEIYYTTQDKTFENWNEGCLEQVNDQCQICQEGWILDEYLQICNQIYGDMIIQGQEQCDDGNQIPYDGCLIVNIPVVNFV